jgi:hypothetical protein
MGLVPVTRKRRILLAVLLVLAVYVGSYLALSRRGLRIAGEWEIEGFVYTRRLLDSLESGTPDRDEAMRLELALFLGYLPAHVVDRLLGGPRYAHVWGPM